jgi:hypothetical protein
LSRVIIDAVELSIIDTLEHRKEPIIHENANYLYTKDTFSFLCVYNRSTLVAA